MSLEEWPGINPPLREAPFYRDTVQALRARLLSLGLSETNFSVFRWLIGTTLGIDYAAS